MGHQFAKELETAHQLAVPSHLTFRRLLGWTLERYELDINNSYHFATVRVAGCDSPQAGLWEHEIFVKHTPTHQLPPGRIRQMLPSPKM